MTISTTTSRVTYQGSGTAGPFAYTFRIQNATDLVVTTTDANGLATTLSYPGDYNVSGVGNGFGGSVTLTQILPVGSVVSIRRDLSLVQGTDLRTLGTFDPATHEDAFDRSVMMTQQQQDELDRTPKLSDALDPADYDMVLPTPAAGKALVWNGAGTGFSNAALSAAQLSAWSAANNVKLDTFVVTTNFTAGVTTQLTLASNPGSISNVSILRRTSGANVQYMSDEFSLASNVITFTSPIPASTTRVEVSYLYTYQINTAIAPNVSWNAAGVGAVGRSVSDKLREIITAADYGAGLGGDDTTKLQSTLTAGAGKHTVIPDGTYTVTGMLTMSGDDSMLEIAPNAVINYATDTFLKVTGARCGILGVKGHGITDTRGVWDGTNGLPTYAVIWVTGDGFEANGVRLTNVKKCGIWIKEAIDADITACRIDGNYPSGSWTGVETGHYGVYFDPPVSPSAGNYKLLGNTIKTCVQGAFAGNAGAGQVIQGFVATGNIFESCWNHGVYTSATNGGNVSSNTFNRCQVAVVMTGTHNVCNGNTLYTSYSVVGDQRDLCGISMRDAQFCTCNGNTIRGVKDASQPVAISFQCNDGVTPLIHNTCNGNTVDLPNGAGYAIRFEGGLQPCAHNTCQGNTLRGKGVADEGLIEFDGLAGAANIANICTGNVLDVLSYSHGVIAINMVASDFGGNTVTFGFDSGAVKSVCNVALSDCVNCVVDKGMTVVLAAYGANLNVYGVREFNTCTGNAVSNQRNYVSLVKALSWTPVQVIPGSLMDIQQNGTSAPTMDCAAGSLWRRTDGATGTTLYINEANGNNWKAKGPIATVAAPAVATDLASALTSTNNTRLALINNHVYS